MNIVEKYKDYRIILASKSPRRQGLFRGLGLDFDVIESNIEETYPGHLKDEAIAIYLAELKAEAVSHSVFQVSSSKIQVPSSKFQVPGSKFQVSGSDSDSDKKPLIITADTIVCIDHHVLNKPKDFEDAKRMLQILSGRMHKVITGLCIKTEEKSRTFSVITDVYFKRLTEEEIEYYINNYKPYDKAGAYGAQEWIGYVAIEHISGSYFNVVGLPTYQLYEELLKF